MERRSKVYVAGHAGLVGSAVVRRLNALGYRRLVIKTRAELDLEDAAAVESFFRAERPDVVVLAAARVGGIAANAAYPAQFIYSNLAIATNVIHAAWQNGCHKFCFLGSSCIYPRLSPQPIHENALLTGPLEPTNEAYAVAKIAGLKMCQAYRREYGFDAISLMPTNLYGPGDNFHPKHAHVLPALLSRFDEAKRAGASEVVIWGTGSARREFLHVDDLAAAIVHLLQVYSSEEIVNVGAGSDISIAELAKVIARTVGYRGQIVTDPSHPDGTPAKLLDISRILDLGWEPRISLHDGIDTTYAWMCDHRDALRMV